MSTKSITDDIAIHIAKKDAWDILIKLSKKDKQIDTFVDFWAQVLNGGIEQWLGNGFASTSNYKTVIKNILEVAKYSKKYGNILNTIIKELERELNSVISELPFKSYEGNVRVNDLGDIFGLEIDDVGYEDVVGEDDDGDDIYETYYEPGDIAAVETFNEVAGNIDKLNDKIYNISDNVIEDIITGIKSKSKIQFAEIVEQQTGINMKKLQADFGIIRQSGHTNMLDMKTVLDLAKSFKLAELSKLRKMKHGEALKLYAEILKNYGK